MDQSENEWAILLQKGNQQAFEKVFSTYYKALYAYAFTIVKEESMAQEIIQEVFYRVWKKKQQLDIQSSLKAYLYAGVYNESMDQLRRQKRFLALKSRSAVDKTDVAVAGAGNKIEMSELGRVLHAAINDLPEQCRTIFQLSRFEGLKYRAIAAQLGLSLKTVEAQMGKALKRLRVALKEFLPLLIFLLWQ